MADAGEDALAQLRAEHGYLLSCHEVLGRLGPAVLDAYGDLYRTCSLSQRFLDQRQRELVLVGLLTACQGATGSQHLTRARAAGVRKQELAAAVTLAGVADAWPALAFAVQHWQSFLDSDVERLYLALVEAGRRPIEPELADLILLVAHGAHRRDAPFVYHLQRAIEAGLPETHLAEAVSYLLLPLGSNLAAVAQPIRDGFLAAHFALPVDERPALVCTEA